MSLEQQRYTHQYLLNNEWKDSESGDVVEIKSPDDNASVGSVPAMSQNEVDAAVESASDVQENWASKDGHVRSELLHRWAEELEKMTDEIGMSIHKEVGKTLSSAKSEVKRTAELIRHTAEEGLRTHGSFIQGDAFPGASRSTKAMVQKVPHGVVLAIAPFNYPVNLAASKIAPALITGNTVVFKPATQGAISGILMVEALVKAGLPKGVLNIVTGRGSVIGDFVVTHPKIDMITFTGGTGTGKNIAKKASMIPVVLELGGKDPAIVLEDADLDLSAKEIVGGAFSYSGQRCTAIKRVMATTAVADELTEKIKEIVNNMKVGKSTEGADIIPMIDQKSADYVTSLVEDAVNKGATVVTSGEHQDNLLSPVVLDHVTEDMRVAWEEQFGPVLPIMRVENELEAIDLEKRNEYGLQASIFTKNLENAFTIADRLNVGTVQVNGKTSRGPDHFPFLGVKNSGQGVQGIGRSIDSMLRDKVLVLNL
ncbi:nonphosphorylating glyceraldehyde-3-phosphate dehydrogenase [Salisediminibacterium halotolerans]|nr:nonphosphorylating glyceraldehyde-3-phosphate dehydrogenase [Actinophytocola xinjiangensis]RPE83903.1 nonphosphorylating glyceraldehyde-3-phosphate dehydrogenase [Salisediminibacterium halotolerans]TWG37853.1 nonphosphorylating glyceraldehyde-3-phosphate dehydrogenase [Salisediminibacterium halotolerans]GEL08690.1 NADP-dependent glyceraldehyde-3-phosphate dehydrogenase [Salisediminibacterium halotolerans]